MRATILFSVAIAVLVVNASPASAQSLGDVAKREELRRTAVSKPAKTYSNAELKADITAPPVSVDPSAAPSSTTTPSTAPSDANAGAAVEAPAQVAKPKEDEAAWRWRAGEIRNRLAKAQKGVDAFTGATPATDPREQARTDVMIKRVQEELRLAVDAQRLFEMQADVAGVPVAWIK